MSDDLIRVRRHGGAAELVFASPPVNAFSLAFLERFCDAVAGLGDDVGAVVLTSEVPRIFAAGGDLKHMAAADLAQSEQYVALVQRAYALMESPAFVSIAAIDGACLAGGFELALACDIRIASPGARVGLPEIGLGIFAGGGAIHRLVRAVGQGVARDLLLTGDPVPAEQALTWGLVSRIADDAAAAGRELARRIGDGPRQALAATKSLAMAASTDELDQGLADELARWLEVRAGADAQEGLDAFGERRPPRFGAAR